MENLAVVLKEAHSGIDKIIKATCYLKDMNDFAEFNAVYSNFIHGHGMNALHARSCVEVARLPRDVLVEVEVIAIVNE